VKIPEMVWLPYFLPQRDKKWVVEQEEDPNIKRLKKKKNCTIVLVHNEILKTVLSL